MIWPVQSWVFSRLLSETNTRRLASITFLLPALGFFAGGISLFLKKVWWLPVVISSAAFSSIVILLFWDGKLQNLDDQGGIGLLINLIIMVALLIIH